jgi:hypothetical protein
MPDLFSLLAVVLALFALFRLRMGVVRLLLLFALAGVAHHLLLT